MAPTEHTDLSGEHGLNITSSQTEALIDNTHNNTAPEIAPESSVLPPTTPEHSASASDALYPSWSPQSLYRLSSSDITEHYVNRALPPLPSDQLRLTCYHGPLPAQQHDSWSTLDALDAEEGPTLLEAYADSIEAHEQLAIGLHLSSLLEYRRADDFGHGRARIKKKVRQRKRSSRLDMAQRERSGGGSRESSAELKSAPSSPRSEGRYQSAPSRPTSDGRNDSRSSSIELDQGYGQGLRESLWVV